MSFLLDLNQIELSGINFAKNLFDSGYVPITGGLITGDLEINAQYNDLSLTGEFSSNSGVIFDKTNRRIGVGAVPEYSFHIKNSGQDYSLYLTGENLSIDLIGCGGRTTGNISFDDDGNLILSTKDRFDSEIAFLNKNYEEILSVTDETSFTNQLKLDEKITINGFKKDSLENNLQMERFSADSESTKFYKYAVYDSQNKNKGDISFLAAKGLGDENYSIISGRNNFTGEWPIIEKNTERGIDYIDITQNCESGDYAVGKEIESAAFNKRQYFVTGDEPSFLRLEPEIDDFYTGQFTIYLKKMGGYPISNKSGIWNEPFSDIRGIARSMDLDIEPNRVKWTIFQRNNWTASGLIRYERWMTKDDLNYNYSVSAEPYFTDTGNFNTIFLYDLGFPEIENRICQIAKYGSLSKDYSIIEYGQGGSTSSLGKRYSELGTEIKIYGNPLLEFGLIKRKLTTEERNIIYDNANLLDSINQEDIGFLFKINAGSGNTVYDVINGYTGTIINHNEDYWI